MLWWFYIAERQINQPGGPDPVFTYYALAIVIIALIACGLAAWDQWKGRKPPV